ncbi:hypothetical protein EDC40_101308 [Aminobacter aminovorans]|uniref:Uncharacterized protein n=1 Tax=Aminobacter aminovorans TaxID=83263 RepID=A0A380WPQ6_AMIAI|nr:hypothetical protein EDC40_101308 [Aminobacter aminovorans]SUU90840.1 Uncharacterised protein [Aminobacter aminovorans]
MVAAGLGGEPVGAASRFVILESSLWDDEWRGLSGKPKPLKRMLTPSSS